MDVVTFVIYVICDRSAKIMRLSCQCLAQEWPILTKKHENSGGRFLKKVPSLLKRRCRKTKLFFFLWILSSGFVQPSCYQPEIEKK